MAINTDYEAPEVASPSFGELQNQLANQQGAVAAGLAGTGGVLGVASGGTGATSASGARSALGAAPSSAKYVTVQAETELSAEVSLGALTTGLFKITVAAGVATPSTAVAGTDYAATGANADITKLLGLTGGLRFLGRTSSAADPTTTELPADKDLAVHKNTGSGDVFLAYNDGGATIKKVLLS